MKNQKSKIKSQKSNYQLPIAGYFSCFAGIQPRRDLLQLLIAFCLLLTVNSFAATNYVWQSSPSPASPYSSWATAAHNIQDAVDAATNGEIVIVAAGIYSNEVRVTPDFTLSNRLVITKKITVKSEEGPDKTVIVGAGPNGSQAIRCVYMTNGASLIGFTLSNGHTRTTASVFIEYFYNKSGGGVFMVDNCYVSNCYFINNSADHSGGGLNSYYGGTVDCCRFTYNTANNGGGISFFMSSSGLTLLRNSVITGNNAVYVGGGVNIDSAQNMTKCFISGNSANNGGGVYLKSFQSVEACTISNNFARNIGGGVYIENGGGHNYLTSCLIVDNVATNNGGGLYQNQFGVCLNCTLVRNSAGGSGGGIYNHYGGQVINSIMYDNFASSGSNYTYFFSNIPYSYCCTTPWTNDPAYHVITNNPEFANPSENDFRLCEWSACINTGYTTGVAWDAIDLDGNPRIYDGEVDLGCYELVPEPFELLWIMTVFSILFCKCRYMA